MGRLVETLRETGQLEDTLVLVSSDNGPEMETWPDAAYSPFRCAKGSTWEGGVRVPAIVTWPGVIDAGRSSRRAGRVHRPAPHRRRARRRGRRGALRTGSSTASTRPRSCSRRTGDSNRKYQYYWLLDHFSAVRVGEYKFMLESISDDDRDVLNPGGFTGVTQRYPYGRLYNLYLDPKETRSYLIRKLAYLDSFQTGIREHLFTFRDYPPKRVVGGGG